MITIYYRSTYKAFLRLLECSTRYLLPFHFSNWSAQEFPLMVHQTGWKSEGSGIVDDVERLYFSTLGNSQSYGFLTNPIFLLCFLGIWLGCGSLSVLMKRFSSNLCSFTHFLNIFHAVKMTRFVFILHMEHYSLWSRLFLASMPTQLVGNPR